VFEGEAVAGLGKVRRDCAVAWLEHAIEKHILDANVIDKVLSMDYAADGAPHVHMK
jgi:hypothetical protein